ncbi:hypothetical protein [Beutenbergia cavernae]|nr:hypothetical protein [Beutenbergia cavernae]
MERLIAQARQYVIEAMDDFSESGGVMVDVAVDIVGSPLAAALEQLDQLVRDLIATLERIIIALGNPRDLERISAAWSADVGGRAMGLVEDIEPSLLEQDRTWTGEASEAYRAVVTIQLRALDDVVDPLVTGIQAALDEAVTAIWTFRAGVVLALLAVIASLPAAVAILPLVATVATGAVAVAGAMWLLSIDLADARSTLVSTGDLMRSDWPRAAG